MSTAAAPDPAPPEQADAARLTGRELLALQLLARGYSLRQLRTLLAAGRAGDAAALLQCAAEGLGVRTVPAAVAEAQRRGLIV